MSAEQLEYCCAADLAIGELASLVNRCFEGYFIPIRLGRVDLLNLIRVDSVDLAASVVVRRAGRADGVALVARRGWNCRLAAMALEPQSRGRGIGTRLTEHVLRTARERGDRELVLECIGQNLPALRLYQSAGFSAVRRLVGYAADAPAGMPDSALEEIDPAQAAAAVSRWSVENLPWQIAAATLTSLGPPHRAFRLGAASAILTDPTAKSLTIRALVVNAVERRQGWGTRLVRALAAEFPDRHWRFSVVIPEEIPGAFFARLGFARTQISQVQMTRPL